jgi:hypothetical protein
LRGFVTATRHPVRGRRALIGDLDDQRIIAAAKLYRRLHVACMFDDVGDSFLHDPIGRGLNAGRHVHWRSVDREPHRQPCGVSRGYQGFDIGESRFRCQGTLCVAVVTKDAKKPGQLSRALTCRRLDRADRLRDTLGMVSYGQPGRACVQRDQ